MENLEGPSISIWLRWRLKDRGITQTAAAAEMGVDPSTFNRWVSGRIIPGPAAIAALAEFLETDEATLANKAHEERKERSWRMSDEHKAEAAELLPQIPPVLDEAERLFAQKEAAAGDPGRLERIEARLEEVSDEMRSLNRRVVEMIDRYAEQERQAAEALASRRRRRPAIEGPPSPP